VPRKTAARGTAVTQGCQEMRVGFWGCKKEKRRKKEKDVKQK